MDMDALIFSEPTPRPAPVMNAAEIMELLLPKGSTSESTFGGLVAIGTSSVTQQIFEELWSVLEEGKNEYGRYRLSLGGLNRASNWTLLSFSQA
jgi:hypothetical protein